MEDWQSIASKKSKFIEDIVQCFIQTSIEYDLVGYILIPKSLIKQIKMIPQQNFRLFFNSLHLLINLRLIVLLAVSSKAIQRIFVNQTDSDISKIDKGLNSQGLAESFEEIEIFRREGEQFICQLQKILIFVLN
jgi:hypothetical protein